MDKNFQADACIAGDPVNRWQYATASDRVPGGAPQEVDPQSMALSGPLKIWVTQPFSTRALMSA